MSNNSLVSRRNFLTGLAVAAVALPMAKSYGAITLTRVTAKRPLITAGFANNRKFNRFDKITARVRVAALKSTGRRLPLSRLPAL